MSEKRVRYTKSGVPYRQYPTTPEKSERSRDSIEWAIEVQAEYFKKNGWLAFADDNS